MTFDPNAAAAPDSGIFGLPAHSSENDDARIVLVPCPFDATTSYGGGASAGPSAILEASKQVDLLDHHFGDVYAAGIRMLIIPEAIETLSRDARALAEPIIARGGAEDTDADREAVARIDDACRACNEYTHDEFLRALRAGATPGLIGGDHSTPYGAIRACCEHLAHLASHGDAEAAGGLGILHVDAHMDLRRSFEGFRFSHASIMRNVLTDLPGVTKLVSVGIRDYCREELDYARAHPDRVRIHFDVDLCGAQWSGTPWPTLMDRVVAELPACVYVSFDIDGLDPSLCPHTGTPVPGGLSFNQAAALLVALARSKKRVIGFDLNEVCPGPNAGAEGGGGGGGGAV
ncbi:MAG: arginase family protein, partial [Phycisphaeraceae bacterium]|nr:arginase family protein [Phycisphaeraceae bacterium]